MKIFIPKETQAEETRCPIVPETVKKLLAKEAEVEVESGIGIKSNFSDEEYKTAGATISTDRKASLSSADMVLRLRKPPLEEISLLKKGSIHISFLDPYNEKELLQEFKKAEVSAISMEMVPRSTIAQKMDALSSQANLAGYYSVILATEKLDKILPMMMTPSGTISPSKVFIIGVGVAGLQAIATAKRLGARVEAFDTRPVVEEQVKSLGAKFVKIDLGEMGETKDGYAKALTTEQLKMQRDGMAKVCSSADIVITTAQLFGRKAPVIVTKEMVAGMKSGSIIVDMAVESGGNVEGSEVNKEVDVNGVKILGLANLPGKVAINSSQMYSANLYNMIDHFWDKEAKNFNLNLEDEIIQGALITNNGEIVNETIKNLNK